MLVTIVIINIILQFFKDLESMTLHMFGMKSFPSKYNILFQNLLALALELMIGSKLVRNIDRFTFFGVPSVLVIWCLTKSLQLAFANLRRLRCRWDFRLPTKERVYCAVHSFLYYGCET